MIFKIFSFSLLLLINLWSCPPSSNNDQIYNLSHVPLNALHRSSMTEERFNEINRWFFEETQELIKEAGGELEIISDWKESFVGAFAQRDKNKWIIRVLGGLARHPKLTEDGYIFVLCHELGHHIGGAPKKKEFFGRRSWSSNEGQADYYASLKCMRRLFKDHDNIHIINSLNIPTIIEKRCRHSFVKKEDQALCMRNSMAGHSHAVLLNRRESKEIYFDTPDKSKVRKTSDKHPNPQCRLDTSFAASICPINHEIRVDDKDPKVGSCTKQVGERPACWFKN